MNTDKTKRLGRGLKSLIGDGSEKPPKVAVSKGAGTISPDFGSVTRSIRLDQIAASPFQPRRNFDDATLDGLAKSIRQAGVMQPVVVRQKAGGFELIAGERRCRAARLAGLEFIPAIINDLDDATAAQWAVIENLQREDLGPLERAAALKSLGERFGLTQSQIAEKVGLDRSTVANLIRLMDLEDKVLSLIERGDLSYGHGRALLAAAPGPQRIALATLAASEGWSVRKTEKQASRFSPQALAAKAAHLSDESANNAMKEDWGRRELERQLGEYLSTRVRVQGPDSSGKGEMMIEFYNLDHFDGLMAKLGFVMR